MLSETGCDLGHHRSNHHQVVNSRVLGVGTYIETEVRFELQRMSANIEVGLLLTEFAALGVQALDAVQRVNCKMQPNRPFLVGAWRRMSCCFYVSIVDMLLIFPPIDQRFYSALKAPTSFDLAALRVEVPRTCSFTYQAVFCKGMAAQKLRKSLSSDRFEVTLRTRRGSTFKESGSLWMCLVEIVNSHWLVPDSRCAGHLVLQN